MHKRPLRTLTAVNFVCNGIDVGVCRVSATAHMLLLSSRRRNDASSRVTRSGGIVT